MAVPALAVQIEGQGAVTADNVNTFVQTADSVAQVRTLTGLQSMKISLSGFTTAGDGGQGIFEWESTSTAPDDDGVTTIQPTGGPNEGRWIRIPNSAPDIAPNTITLGQIVQAPPNTVVVNPTGATGTLQFQPIANFLADLPAATTATAGVVALATEAEAITGINDTTAITPLTLKQANTANVPTLVNDALEADFWQSAQIPIVAGTSGTVTHTLGAKPLRVAAVLICTLAINQYLVGDELQVGASSVQVWAQDNVNTVGYAMASSGVMALNGSGAPFTCTSSNFVLILRAWLI